eukprot:COSAG04_NODE_24244_length_324_cov_1.382222_2_plen_63_part_01
MGTNAEELLCRFVRFLLCRVLRRQDVSATDPRGQMPKPPLAVIKNRRFGKGSSITYGNRQCT